MRVISVIFPWFLCLSVCQGYRLLGVFPFHGKSHFVMFEHLMKGLARKGHQIDVISHFPLKKPYENYTDVVSLEPQDMVVKLSYKSIQGMISYNPGYAIATIGNIICRYLSKPEIQKLVREPPKDPPYDGILIEVLSFNCLGIIGHIWNVPVIGVSSMGLLPWHYRIIALPENLAFMPNIFSSFTSNMNFWYRLYNTVHSNYYKLRYLYSTMEQDDIIREIFGSDMPSVWELEKKIAMILINTHFTLNDVKPTIPAAVEVAGLHIVEEDLELPPINPELEKWMNDSKDGFVYFTFGSMVTIETFPINFLNVLYTSLGKISPVRVLMKISDPKELPLSLPGNIHTFSWMPQIKILQHQNIKAFITHGGLMGTQEAIVYGVPMIGMPLFADQFMNIDRCVARNIAVKIDVNSMTEENLDAALNEVLLNPVYRESARNLSRRFLDRPMNSIDTANYWVEYVIKYGSDALRSPAVDLAWWQLDLIDVIGFLLVCTIMIIIAVFLIIRVFLKMIKQKYDRSLLNKFN